MAKKVMILVGAGQIGLACTRRLGYGMKIVVGGRSLQNAQEICSILNNAGFDAVSVEMYHSILVRGSKWSIIAFAAMVMAKAIASVMSRYIMDQKSRDDIDMRLLLFSSRILLISSN
jgi:hypothetical protein